MSRSADDFYETNAEHYAGRSAGAAQYWIERFMADLPVGASILELGCGGGHDAARFLASGFNVTPTDGTPAMAEQASMRLGRPVAVLRFEEISGDAIYDAVWANACLLHVPRRDLQGVLHRIAVVLKPGGRFYASYKTGGREGRDSLGRYYNRPGLAWLARTYQGAGFAAPTIERVSGGAFDGLATDWLHATAVRQD